MDLGRGRAFGGRGEGMRASERAAGIGRAGMVGEGKRVEVRRQCGHVWRGRRGVAGSAWIRRGVEFHGHGESPERQRVG